MATSVLACRPTESLRSPVNQAKMSPAKTSGDEALALKFAREEARSCGLSENQAISAQQARLLSYKSRQIQALDLAIPEQKTETPKLDSPSFFTECRTWNKAPINTIYPTDTLHHPQVGDLALSMANKCGPRAVQASLGLGPPTQQDIITFIQDVQQHPEKYPLMSRKDLDEIKCGEFTDQLTMTSFAKFLGASRIHFYNRTGEQSQFRLNDRKITMETGLAGPTEAYVSYTGSHWTAG